MRGDWRIPGVVVLLLGWMVAVLAIPLGRTLFELTRAPGVAVRGASSPLAVVWSLLCRLVWRTRLLDGWLGTAEDPGNVCARGAAPKPV